MLKFDAEITRLLDHAYQGSDITTRRRASFDALKPNPGEIILDIGCGNGLLTAELARTIGPGGRVIGIDPSQDMIAVAKTRCSDYRCVEFLGGTAGDLPVESGTADKAVSVQVFEYIDDIKSAVTETMRCLKPGGRLVISDVHFGSLIWFSDVPSRMSRMIASWDQHCVHPGLSEHLPGVLRAEGHLVEDVVPVTVVDTVLRPDGMAIMMMLLMRQYAIDQGHLDPEESRAWFDEQHALARDGRFFFSITQFVVVARKGE